MKVSDKDALVWWDWFCKNTLWVLMSRDKWRTGPQTGGIPGLGLPFCFACGSGFARFLGRAHSALVIEVHETRERSQGPLRHRRPGLRRQA